MKTNYIFIFGISSGPYFYNFLIKAATPFWNIQKQEFPGYNLWHPLNTPPTLTWMLIGSFLKNILRIIVVFYREASHAKSFIKKNKSLHLSLKIF